MTISIRRATAEDVPALVQLRMANAERHAAIAPSSHRRPDPAAVGRYFAARLAPPAQHDADANAGAGDAPYATGSVLLVAEVADTVAGMTEVVMMPVPPDHQILVPRRLAEVHTVVLERYRGRGIGRALVAAAEHYAASHGVSCLLAPILAGNTEAVGFYTQAGFGDHGTILSKELGSRLPAEPSRGPSSLAERPTVPTERPTVLTERPTVLTERPPSSLRGPRSPCGAVLCPGRPVPGGVNRHANPTRHSRK